MTMRKDHLPRAPRKFPGSLAAVPPTALHVQHWHLYLKAFLFSTAVTKFDLVQFFLVECISSTVIQS